MAERVVSPGVFTNEIDQSFLPAAISQLGAALIGTCQKGPAFVPTVVNDYQDFQLKFGALDSDHFLPYTAKSYLKNSGTATIVRILGTGGYNANKAIVIGADETDATDDTAATGNVTAVEQNISKYYAGGASWAVQTGQKLTLSGQPNTNDTFILTTTDGRVKTYKFGSGTSGADEGSNVTTVNIAGSTSLTGDQLVLAIAAANGHQHRATGTNSSGDVTLTHTLGGVPTAAVGVNGSGNLAVTAGTGGAGSTGIFVLDDGAGKSVTFTFGGTTASSGVKTDANNYIVGLTGMAGTNTAIADIETRIRTAIALAKTNSDLGITAADGSGGVTTVTQDTKGASGNTIITHTDAASAFTVTGFTSGFDGGNTALAVIFPTGSGYDSTAPTFHATDATLTDCGDATSGSIGAFCLKWDGTFSDTMSLDLTSASYAGNLLGIGAGPTGGMKESGYVYKIFPNAISKLTSLTAVSASTVDHSFGNWASAKTPYITSQTSSVCEGTTCYDTNLFKFETLSAGDSSNKEIKIGIQDVEKAGQIAGSDYGKFSVVVRKFNDTDARPQTLETFTGCNLDPDSSNFVVRRIGDMKQEYNSTTSKLVITGDFPNMSKYIRLTDISQGLKGGTLSKDLVPWGHSTYQYPFNVGNSEEAVDFHWKLNHNDANGQENLNKYYPGAAFDSGSTSLTGPSKDNLNWFDVIPSTPGTHTTASIQGVGVHGTNGFRLDLVDSGSGGETVNLDSPIGYKKFVVGFQGGFDGFDPRYYQHSGSGRWNGTEAYDSGSFNDAISTISNPDEIDINMIVIPGIERVTYPKIIDRALLTAEDRADVFVPFDTGNYDSSITDVTSNITTMDNNFASTYYPWVKIFDDENNKHVWVPPSVVVPGVIAFNDKVSHEWFAPAGLNRGSIIEATMAKDRLTHSDRDDLYSKRVNPIASFPGEGVVVWGQKTLQAKPSALDRVNVRRLLIAVKKFIASSSRYLVFEQNTESTRQKFLNIVNPYMEQVQANSGLTAFKVVMDGSNNTPDVVDRNELRGSIFVQPARTAEFIVLDFVVMPSGATFPE